MFDDIDMLLLSSWRELWPSDELKKIGRAKGFDSLPGLRHWHQTRICAERAQILFLKLLVCSRELLDQLCEPLGHGSPLSECRVESQFFHEPRHWSFFAA